MHVHVVEGYFLVVAGNDVGGVDQVGVVVDLVDLVGMALNLVGWVADLVRLMVDLVGMVMGFVGLDHSFRGPLLTAESLAGERGRDGGHEHHAQQ